MREPSDRLSADLDQVVARLGVEALVPVFGRCNDVLDSHAELTGKIDPWLDAETLSNFQQVGRPFDDERLFVAPKADSVAGSVHEVGAEAGVFNRLSGRAIHILGSYA